MNIIIANSSINNSISRRLIFTAGSAWRISAPSYQHLVEVGAHFESWCAIVTMGERYIRERGARVLSVLLLVAQSALLDVFLINGRPRANYTWIVVDVITLIVWITLLAKPGVHTVVYNALRNACAQCCGGAESTDQGPQELRGMWVSWLVYSCISLAPRLGVIYYELAPDMTVDTVFGANLLKVTLSLTAALFLCLIASHIGPEAYTYDKYYLERVQSGVVLDILDSGEVLDTFFTEEQRDGSGEEFHLTSALAISLLVFAMINLALPTFALAEAEKQRDKRYKFNFGRHLWTNAKVWYIFLNTILVNVPFLVLRIVLWVEHDRQVSVLLVKNVIFIIMNILDLVEYLGSKRCDDCKLLYPSNHLASHRRKRCRNFQGDSESDGAHQVSVPLDDMRSRCRSSTDTDDAASSAEQTLMQSAMY